MLAECDFCGGAIDEAIPDCSTCTCEQQDDDDYYDHQAHRATLAKVKRWKKPDTTKRASPLDDMTGVLIGPKLKTRDRLYWLIEGDPRIQVNGRWLSGRWGFRMLYVSKVHKLPVIERKRLKRIAMLDRIARRHDLTRWLTTPF